MRTIKFRAWDGKRVRFDVTGFEHGKLNEMAGVFLDGDYFAIDGALHLPNAEVMQFTGLLDKNGVEIYEGDLLKAVSDITSEVLVVTYFMGNACYSFPRHLETGTALYPTLITMTKEVIGNIHENPRLLEQSI